MPHLAADCLLNISLYIHTPCTLLSFSSINKSSYRVLISSPSTANLPWANMLKLYFEYDAEEQHKYGDEEVTQKHEELGDKSPLLSSFQTFKQLKTEFRSVPGNFLSLYSPLYAIRKFYMDLEFYKPLQWENQLDLRRFVLRMLDNNHMSFVEEGVTGMNIPDYIPWGEARATTDEMVLFFHLNVGQNLANKAPPLFGQIIVYDHMLAGRIIPVEESLRYQRTTDFKEAYFFITHQMYNRAVMLCDKDDLKRGQVVMWRNGEWIPVSDSLPEFLNAFVQQLHDYAPKVELMENRIQALNRFPTVTHVGNRRIGSRVTTRGITVQANAIFIREFSSEDRSFFAYQITMTMEKNPDAPRLECELESRHWEITHPDGEVDIVDGEGVIGFYPQFDSATGGEFSYVSCCPMDRLSDGSRITSATMKGSFQFKNLANDERFDVVVGEYPLTEDVYFV